LNIHRVLSTAVGAFAVAAMSLPPMPAFADSIRDRQWYLQSLDISRAHAITEGSGVVVAVIDTGTHPHPDIRRNLIAGIDETANGSGNGQTDVVGHGTGMASLIAAHGRSSNSGVLGIAPAAKIMPVRVTRTGNNIVADEMARGIGWATSRHARVINVSAGAGPADELEQAVSTAIADDIVVIAAVGNTSNGVIIDYPAALDGVLAVGATGRDGEHASVSIKSAKIQLCAPGVDITTARPGGGYSTASGTSDATAIVSGAVALVRAKFPRLSGPEVVHRLAATADDNGPPGRDDECGFGRLNIVKALTADVPPLAGATAAPAPTVTSAGSVQDGYLDPGATTATTPAAQPASNSTPLLLGTLSGLVVAGGVVGFLVLRRRRRDT
jgi:type VII secretion-associated serine protease mycosin